jgi:hypothetical protein
MHAIISECLLLALVSCAGMYDSFKLCRCLFFSVSAVAVAEHAQHRLADTAPNGHQLICDRRGLFGACPRRGGGGRGLQILYPNASPTQLTAILIIVIFIFGIVMSVCSAGVTGALMGDFYKLHEVKPAGF